MGKIVGTLLGYVVFNVWGALIGFALGYYFDRGLNSVDNTQAASASRNIQQNFFETLFLLLGMLAKSDGRVSEEEVKGTEQLMTQMGLTDEQRKAAIDLFKRGAQPEFDVDACMKSFVAVCGGTPQLQRTLLDFLLYLAFADEVLHAQERVTLEKVAYWLGVRGYQFEQVLAMAQAQYQFGQKQAAPKANDLATAYQALGVAPDATDKEVKRAYRKLMSENHPDKLIAQGVPDSVIQLANEKSAEISTAYDLITKVRSGQ